MPLLLIAALAVSLTLSTRLAAQELVPASPKVLYPVLIVDGQSGSDFQTFDIPEAFEGKLELYVEGGDGGSATYEAFFNTATGAGGPGAWAHSVFRVGSQPGQIPPGSQVRFIIGRLGLSVSGPPSGREDHQAGGGGGGTAVYMKPPGLLDIESNWQLLIGAGGGGGGGAGPADLAGIALDADGRYGRYSSDGFGDVNDGGDGNGGGGSVGPGTQPGDGGIYLGAVLGGGGGEGGAGTSGGGGGTLFSGGGAGGERANPLSTSSGGGSGSRAGGAGWGGGGEGGGNARGGGGGGGGLSGGGGGGIIGGGGGGGSFISPDFSPTGSFIIARGPRSEDRVLSNGLAVYSIEPNYTVSPVDIYKPRFAGTQNVQISVAGDGAAPWTAIADDPWLSVNIASGTGSANVQISFDEYTDPGSRTGSVTVAGYQVFVTQVGVPIVTNAGDDLFNLAGSLRGVIAEAAPGDTIVFDPSLSGATIFLSSSIPGQLVIDKDLEIDATALEDGLTIDANSSGLFGSRVMTINNGAIVSLNGLTLTGGFLGGGFSSGGAISLEQQSQLVLSQCVLTGNSAGFGGAISNSDGVVIAINSTFYGNSATVSGGAIANIGSGAFSWVLLSTVVGNDAGTSGGGLSSPSAGLRLQNSIVAGNASPSGPDVLGAVEGSTSLIGDPAGATGLGVGLTGYLTGDPRLAPFADWSGPSSFMPPLPGSPVVDAAGPTPQATDQRGAPRPLGLADLGSVELFGFPQPPEIDTDGDLIDDRLEPLYPQFTLGVDDSDLDSDGDGALDWDELAQATDPDDAADFPVPEPGFFMQLVIGSAFLLSAPGLRGRRQKRL
jgi:hypothetical protein